MDSSNLKATQKALVKMRGIQTQRYECGKEISRIDDGRVGAWGWDESSQNVVYTCMKLSKKFSC